MNSSKALVPSILGTQHAAQRKYTAAETAAGGGNEFRQGIREEELAAHSFLALPDAALTLVCLAGELWLTRDGDIEDHILGVGQGFTIRRGDQAAVQALRPSRIRLIGN